LKKTPLLSAIMVKVIIPAFNEENGIEQVLKDIPASLVEEVIVVNNASTDQTKLIAEEGGATVVTESRKGYGRACLKGLSYINELKEKPDIVVFLDADYSDYPEEMEKLIAPIIYGEAELVIGSRALGKRQKGSMTPPQIFGNWLATRLIKLFYGIKFTDLGPFRAVDYKALLKMDMQDKTYGWTVEMQLKAAKMGVKCVEVPVNYRPRIGFSKISGTVKGTVMAGYKIITTIFRYL
jgi:glycosyltransferase involved in cell wall biosynthesis